MLLEGKANVNAADRLGVTALHLAAVGGHEDVARLLILGHANIKAQDANGCAPVHFAAVGPNENLVGLLLGDGAAFSGFCADKEGRCAIHWAADAGRLENVRAIVRAHMRRCLSMKPKAQRGHKALMLNVKDVNEQTPLDLALKEASNEAHLETARYLLKHRRSTIGRTQTLCCFSRSPSFEDARIRSALVRSLSELTVYPSAQK